MTFRSYAQNSEDVVLWRALKHVSNGCYIDIGANDPIVDSVSLAFYEHGWRGIHVEPMPDYAAALRAARADETVIEAAIAQTPGKMRLEEFANSGLTTAKADYAEAHRQAGWQSKQIEVPTRTLASLFDDVKATEIHWLKIDVEGMEAEVLASWGASALRPWVLAIESTLPNSSQQDWQAWEHFVTDREYRFAYFDGLNRFYVHKSRAELLSGFGPGPSSQITRPLPDVGNSVGAPARTAKVAAKNVLRLFAGFALAIARRFPALKRLIWALVSPFPSLRLKLAQWVRSLTK